MNEASSIALVGILITALFSSIGYFYTNLTRGRKSSKKVLYLLLEIRHAIRVSILDPKVITEKYWDYYCKKLNLAGMELNRNEVPQIEWNLAFESFQKNIESQKTNIQERLLIPYENSLLNMAELSPVLAYQLKGKEKLEDSIENIRQHSESCLLKFQESNNYAPYKDQLMEFTEECQQEAMSQISTLIDDDILCVAKKCGRSTYKECESILEKKTNFLDEYDFSEFDLSINLIIKKMFPDSDISQQPK